MKPNSFDSLEYKRGSLHMEGVSLAKLAQEHGTPLYVYSTQSLLASFNALKNGLKEIDPLICFAVKSNSNLSVLKLLGDAGAGMDLVSGGELMRAKMAGIDPSRMVFSGVGKTPTEIALALEEGVFSFNAESVEELEWIETIAEKLDLNARVALRFNPNVDAKTHPYISTGLKKNKFGLNESEVLAIAKSASSFNRVQIAGLSIHIGSQLLSLAPLDEAFGKLKETANKLNALLPEPLTYLDIGGGVGIHYEDEKAPKISDYCKLVLKHFKTAKSGKGKKAAPPFKILMEPGRLIAGNAGVLLSQVLYRKPRGKKDFLVIDAGMNDLARPSLYGSKHQIIPVEGAKTHGKQIKTDIVGPVCESSDLFRSDYPLSPALESTDLVAILSAGAYGFSMSSTYNSRPRPAEILVKGKKATVVRKRETYEDLVRGEAE